MYPKEYHTAMHLLIRGAEPTEANRRIIASALRALRRVRSTWDGKTRQRIPGTQWARQARRHMLYVNPLPFMKRLREIEV